MLCPKVLAHTLPKEDVVVLLQTAQARLVNLAEKERLLRSGVSYGHLLMAEAIPSEIQEKAFKDALARNGARTGQLIAQLTKVALAQPQPVLISLARAGTPVGCVMSRMARAWGYVLPHYTLSIIRGEGVDLAALGQVYKAHPDATFLFIDGWTGKGSIMGTLQNSLPKEVPAQLYVLSDPAGVASYAATFEDFLIPHALLNATVCGLVSRTVLTAPQQMHGARIEEHLRPYDQTLDYLDVLTAYALAAETSPSHLIAPSLARPNNPMQQVYALAQKLGVTNPHLVKPSVGEATRVFLRRQPKHLLLRNLAHPDTQHLYDFAANKGIAVTEDLDLPYLAAALIDEGGQE